jgi:hypothetical protein
MVSCCEQFSRTEMRKNGTRRHGDTRALYLGL